MNEHMYSEDEICKLLEQAHEKGFSLGAGSELEKLTIAQLEILLKWRQ